MTGELDCDRESSTSDGDRRQNFATWAHWKTQLLQIVFAKMPQRIQIYFVLGEYLLRTCLAQGGSAKRQCPA